MAEFQLIDDPEGFDAVAKALEGEDEIVLDLEADSFFHYKARICLAQIAVPGHCWIVDPFFEGFDHERLTAVLAGKTLLLHGCDYDLRLMRSLWNFVPARIVDTAIGARLLGHRAFGLGNLVEKYFGVHLDKSKQQANWARRPLAPDMLKYAAGDTAYLREMVGRMRDELAARGRLSWAEESCAHLLKTSQEPSVHVKEDPWRVPGHNELDRRGQALLRVLWNWREEQARKRDLPPFKVLNNDRLVLLARLFVGKASVRPEDLPKLPRHFGPDTLASLAETIRGAAQIPEEEWPRSHRPRHAPGPSPDSRVLDRLKEIRRAMAEELDLEESLLATKPQINSLALHGRSTEEEIRSGTALMEWQYGLWIPKILNSEK